MKTTGVYMMLILLIVSEDVFSQNRKDGRIPSLGFNAGISHYQVKEGNLNGLVHRGPGFNAAALYFHWSSNAMQRLELMVGMGFLKTGFEEETGTYLIQTSISYQYNRLAASFNDRWGLYLGGMASLNARQGIYEKWDKNHFHWLTDYSLGFSVLAKHEISNRSGISLELGVPLLSVISRTPKALHVHEANPEFMKVLSQIHEQPSLEILPVHFSLELKAAYHLKPGKRMSQTLFWRMNYVNNHVATSNQFKSVNNTFGIEFLF